MDTGSSQVFYRRNVKQFKWTIRIPYFFNLYIFSYFWEKQTRPGTDDDRLLQLLNFDDFEFEWDSEDSTDEVLYPEAMVEKDLDLGEASFKGLEVNNSKKLGVRASAIMRLIIAKCQKWIAYFY